MKYNTILTHLAVLMLLDLNNSSILYLNPDKLINILIFDKYGLGTLDNLKIRINTGNDLVYLGNYLLLSYVIYYMSSMMIRYKIYEIETENVDVKKGVPPLDRLRIMHTIVHTLSVLIDRKIKQPDEYLYTILANNYFIKILTVFDQNVSKNTLKELRYNSEKRLHPNDNQLVKKLLTKKQTLYEINGILKSYISSYNYKSKKLYLRYFPIKVDNRVRTYSEEEINTMIKKDLIWMYKSGDASMKLNIDMRKKSKLLMHGGNESESTGPWKTNSPGSKSNSPTGDNHIALDEKVARLQLTKLNAELTTLSIEQANYIGVKEQGPYKPEHYRY
jgi:hypothetical protein